MERKSKLSISLTLTIIAVLTISAFSAVVFAQPIPIGDAGWTQAESFDSNPTVSAKSTNLTTTGALTAAYDGSLLTNVNFLYGTNNGYAQWTGFKRPTDNGLTTDFDITFIDIKVDYRALATAASDDQYRIVAYVDPSPTAIILQDWVYGNDPTAHNAMYPPGINAAAAVRTFSNIAEPNDGVWTWDDMASLRVRVEGKQTGVRDSGGRIYINEVWVTAYPSPYPAELTMSVQPPVIMKSTGGEIYVDIYVTGVTKLWGYQFQLSFDPAVLTPDPAEPYMSYGPFISALPSEVGPDYIAMAYKTYDGDPTGFTGSTPVARLYFQEIGGPTDESPLHFVQAIASDVYGAAILLTAQDGVYNPGAPEFPLGLGIVMLLIPAFPVVYLWRVRKKERA